MSEPNSDPEQYTTIDTRAVEWDRSFNLKLGVDLGRLMLRKDPINGAEIRMIRYLKGIVNPEHTHPCGHGFLFWKANFVPTGAHMGPEHRYGFRRAKRWSMARPMKAT